MKISAILDTEWKCRSRSSLIKFNESNCQANMHKIGGFFPHQISLYIYVTCKVVYYNPRQELETFGCIGIKLFHQTLKLNSEAFAISSHLSQGQKEGNSGVKKRKVRKGKKC